MTLRWTREKPSQPGWYWWRNLNLKDEADRGPFVYFVRDYAGEMAIGNARIKGFARFEQGDWAGPLTLPEEPTNQEGG